MYHPSDFFIILIISVILCCIIFIFFLSTLKHQIKFVPWSNKFYDKILMFFVIFNVIFALFYFYLINSNDVIIGLDEKLIILWTTINVILTILFIYYKRSN